MKKIKGFFKKNYKFMIGVILGLTLASPIVQAANYLFQSNQVSYDNSSSGLTSTDVKSALDELYSIARPSGVKFSDYLKGLSAGTNVIADDGTGDHNMRYTGATPNNYVTFAGEEWRVIGVFNNVDDGTGKKEARVKIIKSTTLGDKKWHSSSTNIWKSSSLSTELQASTYASNNMVDNAVWYLGDPGGNYDYTASQAYEKERGTTVASGNDATWKGKVGLMYPSDYGFASSACKNGEQNLFYYDSTNYDCNDTDWLYIDANEWLLSPKSGTTAEARIVNIESRGGTTTPTSTDYENISAIPLLQYNYGFRLVPLAGGSYDYRGDVESTSVNTAYTVRPTVYLKSSIVCTNCSDSNAGTQGNPFQIELA